MSKRLEMLDGLIAKGATDPFVHYARAMELRSIGRSVEALTAFETVAETFPMYVPTYLIAAQVAESLGNASAARDLLERGIVVARNADDTKALGEMKALLATIED